MNDNYLSSVKRQFEYYKLLAEKTFEQIDESGFFWRNHPEDNSIAVIIKHLHGNMMSRWTDFLNSDGEKEWRNRDGEFEENAVTKEDLMKLWKEGWDRLFATLQLLQADDLLKIIYIRNQGHTAMEAINRQLAHYPYHIGQIVFIGKMIRKEKWTSLSIPKNKSKEFNQEKFSSEKKQSHFTDEYLKKKK